MCKNPHKTNKTVSAKLSQNVQKTPQKYNKMLQARIYTTGNMP